MVTYQQYLWWEQHFGFRPETIRGTIASAATPTQLGLIPAWPPDNGRSEMIAIKISNPSTSTAATLVIWDQYINDPTGFTTAGTRGSAALPLLRWNIPAGADILEEVLTREYFQAGVAGQSSLGGLFFSIRMAHAGNG